ncbi:MICOS complex subunit Mic25 [Geodia barretti]|uniref:MICOS complex subunit Mic25 n=1 Tax=Geodia barretti TaxID=519541 RepID=A0AA35W0N6_GEOBA|nr:MICOS complex subunit Mic25 [Geodia barretti]
MTFVPELAVREMGSGQSSGEGEREVTVEERAGEDGPQIIISSALPGGRRGGERREVSVWQRKYELEREKNSELKHVTDDEFVKTVGEIRQKFQEADVLDMLPVCEDKRNEVLRCYQSHPRKPLLCSDEVKAFSSCVETARQVCL